MTMRIACVMAAAVLMVSATHAAQAPRGVPTPGQIAWHEMEIEMFLCLDPCTWQGREYDDHSTPLSEINPAQIDTDQWCEVAQLFGAKQILFVAKHTGGFCWWQTVPRTTASRTRPGRKGRALYCGPCRELPKYGLKRAATSSRRRTSGALGIGSGQTRTRHGGSTRSWPTVTSPQRYGQVSEVWV